MSKKHIKDIDKIISLLKKEVAGYETPMSTEIAERTRSAFQVFVSCIMSLRTKDTITAPTSKKLFEVADTPEKIVKMPLSELEKRIRPVNYYKTKAKNIKEASKRIVDEFNSEVPDDFDTLMSFKGVGRKTANITMVYGHGSKDHIPVDIHVHRIPNRIGWLKTKTPEDTEPILKEIIPKKYWMIVNDLLVMHGQNICVPISPFCSKCAITKYCKRIGVEKTR